MFHLLTDWLVYLYGGFKKLSYLKLCGKDTVFHFINIEAYMPPCFKIQKDSKRRKEKHYKEKSYGWSCTQPTPACVFQSCSLLSQVRRVQNRKQKYFRTFKTNTLMSFKSTVLLQTKEHKSGSQVYLLGMRTGGMSIIWYIKSGTNNLVNTGGKHCHYPEFHTLLFLKPQAL